MTLSKDEVLWQWQTTGLSASQIGDGFDTTKGVVLGIVHRARLAGDVRATMRRAPTRMQLLKRIDDLAAEMERVRAMVARHV